MSSVILKALYTSLTSLTIIGFTCQESHYIFSIKNMVCSALLGFIELRFLEIISPAFENRRSLGTLDVAGIMRYSRATADTHGNRC